MLRAAFTAFAIALLTVSAHAEGMGGGKGRHQQTQQKPEDAAKKKAQEQAYKDALKSIPNSNAKQDPWASMR